MLRGLGTHGDPWGPRTSQGFIRRFSGSPNCNLYLLPDNQIAHDFGHHRSCRVRSCLVWISLRFIWFYLPHIRLHRRISQVTWSSLCRVQIVASKIEQRFVAAGNVGWHQTMKAKLYLLLVQYHAANASNDTMIHIIYIHIIYILYIIYYTNIWVNYIDSHCNLTAMMVSIGK